MQARCVYNYSIENLVFFTWFEPWSWYPWPCIGRRQAEWLNKLDLKPSHDGFSIQSNLEASNVNVNKAVIICLFQTCNTKKGALREKVRECVVSPYTTSLQCPPASAPRVPISSSPSTPWHVFLFYDGGVPISSSPSTPSVASFFVLWGFSLNFQCPHPLPSRALLQKSEAESCRSCDFGVQLEIFGNPWNRLNRDPLR